MVNQPKPSIEGASLKRYRDDVHLGEQTKSETKANKIPNRSKSTVYDFKCSVYYQRQILDFQLSQAFERFRFAVLFFCNYDFTPQSKEDLSHIEHNYKNFIEFGAVPIVITHDRANIHQAYATPGKTISSLDFEPSFIMASDATDRLISRSFKAMDSKTTDIKRSVIIIDHNLQILFNHTVLDKRYFPMKLILDCFKQANSHH